MMMRSAPPFSMNLALMPVPAPAAMMGSPFERSAKAFDDFFAGVRVTFSSPGIGHDSFS